MSFVGAILGAGGAAAYCAYRWCQRRDGRTYCARSEVQSAEDAYCLDVVTAADRGWPVGAIMQISGCMDQQTSADAKDAEGKPCGACTQSFLRTVTQNAELSWIQLLNEQRWWLEVGVKKEQPGAPPYTQTPRLSISAWADDLKTIRSDLQRPACFTRNTLGGGGGGGRRRALLIGINYKPTHGNPSAGLLRTHPEWGLDGCVPDQVELRRWLLASGWAEDEITIMTDGEERGGEVCRSVSGSAGWPSRANVERELKRLVGGLAAGDFVWFSFSGHGLQTAEQGTLKAEVDGMDELLFCGDGGVITDDWLCDKVMRKVPPGCQMFNLVDCCHSGTILDLPLMCVLRCGINSAVQTICRKADGSVEHDEDGSIRTRDVQYSALCGRVYQDGLVDVVKRGRRQ